jgi:hypothetical protein
VAKSPLLSDRMAAAEGSEGGNQAARSWHEGRRPSPDKVSRDSGVPSPSDAGSVVTTDSNEHVATGGGGAASSDKDSSLTEVTAAGTEANKMAGGATSAVASPGDTQDDTVSIGGGVLQARPPASRPAVDGTVRLAAAQTSSRLNGLLPVKAELVTNELDPSFTGESTVNRHEVLK